MFALAEEELAKVLKAEGDIRLGFVVGYEHFDPATEIVLNPSPEPVIISGSGIASLDPYYALPCAGTRSRGCLSSFPEMGPLLTAIATTRAPLADLHARFHDILPVVHAEGNVAFGNLRLVEDREDAVAESALTAEKFLRAVTESVAIDPYGLARRAVASVVRRRHRQALLAA